MNAQHNRASTAEAQRRLGPLGRSLDQRLVQLQRDYLSRDPAALAAVARLRRGLGKPAGAVPEIWELTVGTVPARLSWGRDEPSRAEEAAHAALTLYAMHQQSLSEPAHDPQTPIGQALGRLVLLDRARQTALTRRFMAVATAQTVDELLVHLRGLVMQLRTARRGMDYARFADDLVDLLTPGRESAVRLAWGRQFYRTADLGADTEPEEAATETEATTEGDMT